jgi:hypothetical protein
MSLNVVQTLRSLPVHEAMRLIGNAPHFISDSNFINMLNQYDPNSKQKDATLISQLNLFAGIPLLKAQVQNWLNSRNP